MVNSMKKIYYKHIIVRSGEQDDVEKEINSYVNSDEDINIISLNVIPEQYNSEIGGYVIPKCRYHISLVYNLKS